MTSSDPDAHVVAAASALDGPVGRPVARNLAALATSRVVATLLQFVAFASLAAALGPSRLGTYVFAIAAPGLLKLLADFGFQVTVARDVAQDPDRERALVPNLFYLRLFLGAICFVAIRYGLPLFGYRGEIRDAAMITAVSLLVVSLDAFRISLEVRLAMVWVAVADVLEAVTMFVGIIVLARSHGTLAQFLWLYVAANALNLVVIALRGLATARFDWRPLVRSWWPLIRSAAPLGAASLVIALYYRLDVVILARFRSADAVGQYGTAYRFLDAFGVLPGLLMAVLNPVFSRSFVLGTDVFKRRLDSVLHLLALPGALVAVGGAMTAWRVLPVLPGFEKYAGAGDALAILAPAAALILVGAVLGGVLVNAHLQRSLLGISLVVLVVNVALNAALIPLLSYRGAAVATTLSELAVVVSQLRVIRRKLALRASTPRLARVGVATLVMAVVAVPAYALDPLLQLAIVVVTYAIAVVAVGAVGWGDLAALTSADGPSAVVRAPSAGPPTDDEIGGTSLLAVRRQLRGCSSCVVVSSGAPADSRFALAARLAGCAPVTLRAPGGAGRGSWWWRLVVDRPVG